MSVDSSLTSVFPPLVTGGCLHLIPHEKSLDAAALQQYFAANAIDCVKIAPSHLAALNAVLPRPLMPRRLLIVGGEASRREWIMQLRSAEPGCRIVNHYGPTETTVGVTYYPVTDTTGELDSATLPIGRPLPNTRAYVLDDGRQLVPVGVRGELYLGGDCLARGYLNRPEHTARAYIPDPLGGGDAGRLYAT
ncbi:MAG: amino acid adenylation domain-containing protein, partial [bacterium]|nr:amino acid adenylation domain-containing protein [bacterium]